MDFFREKKQAEAILSDFADSGNMYLWDIEDAYKAAVYIFGLGKGTAWANFGAS